MLYSGESLCCRASQPDFVAAPLLVWRLAINRPAPIKPKAMSDHCSAVGLSRVGPMAMTEATAGVIAGMNDAVTRPRIRAE